MSNRSVNITHPRPSGVIPSKGVSKSRNVLRASNNQLLTLDCFNDISHQMFLRDPSGADFLYAQSTRSVRFALKETMCYFSGPG